MTAGERLTSCFYYVLGSREVWLPGPQRRWRSGVPACSRAAGRR